MNGIEIPEKPDRPERVVVPTAITMSSRRRRAQESICLSHS